MGEDETIGSFRDSVTGRDITIAEILAGKRQPGLWNRRRGGRPADGP